jgi:hypothetical protein
MTSYHLEHEGTILNDYFELAEYPSLLGTETVPHLKLVPGYFTPRNATCCFCRIPPAPLTISDHDHHLPCPALPCLACPGRGCTPYAFRFLRRAVIAPTRASSARDPCERTLSVPSALSALSVLSGLSVFSIFSACYMQHYTTSKSLLHRPHVFPLFFLLLEITLLARASPISEIFAPGLCVFKSLLTMFSPV